MKTIAMHRIFFFIFVLAAIGCSLLTGRAQGQENFFERLRAGFLNPPDSCKPGVYWYFMDGNLSGDGIRKDLEAMKEAGIGHVIFLEVNVGVPRGKVDFLSPEWLSLFKVIEQEAEKQGIAITLGIGPGWTGSGGPWVTPDRSMQHLVSSIAEVGPADKLPVSLPVPAPKHPFFGDGSLTPGLRKERNDFYKDVAVLAFPATTGQYTISNIDNKALYYRSPYSSVANVHPFYPPLTSYSDLRENAIIDKSSVIDITDKLNADGSINWKPSSGRWTVMRFGSRNNGAATRPAPMPGLGFEADKFDTIALTDHLEHYIGKILAIANRQNQRKRGGLEFLHMDSWEMGAQNWTGNFRKAFMQRRGYDPLPFYPVYAGRVVGSAEVSDRFLWDLRRTAHELVMVNHAMQVKKYAYRKGMRLSIEPYDMNPTADLELGAVADIPMCEFWSKGFGFNTQFSCAEATSIGHVLGKPVIAAEAFTAQDNEAWKQYPASMKNQGDWAFATGINKFFYHTFQSQCLADSLKPGMTMGPYGVQWNRNQTWWPMAAGYHQYVARCSYLLQQGNTVADILYLTPEEAPFVFSPPSSALGGDADLKDRKGYNFDACAPGQVYAATVSKGKIYFPGGASYHLLVLPDYAAMSPKLLQKIIMLVKDGATVIGPPPQRAPGLSGYPASDAAIKKQVAAVWGYSSNASQMTSHKFGKGVMIWGEALRTGMDNLYCNYDILARVLKSKGLAENFISDKPLRYTQRQTPDADIFFVSNTTEQTLTARCRFRTSKHNAALWDAETGRSTKIKSYSTDGKQAVIDLPFTSYQSYFVIFTDQSRDGTPVMNAIPATTHTDMLTGSWQVAFDPKWGGPAEAAFNTLSDWSRRPEEGIKYYSGIATYTKTFDAALPSMSKNTRIYLDLGDVKNMARVKLNGKDLGVLWTAPWSVDISDVVRSKENKLEISIANLWINRLIGDQQWPDDGVKDGKWPAWLLAGKPREGKRYTFTTYNPYKKDDPLMPSGLLGPVSIVWREY